MAPVIILKPFSIYRRFFHNLDRLKEKIHIQQSPHCFDSQHKNTTTLHNKCTTPNSTHTNYTLQTHYMSQIAQLSKLAISVADTFVTKAHFNSFFPHQTQRKRDNNVHEKAWRTLFTVCPVLDVPSHPSTQEVGRGVGLAANISYTRTSTDSYSSLLSLHIWISSDPNRLGPDSFSHNSQFRCTKRNQTAGKIPVQLAPLQV